MRQGIPIRTHSVCNSHHFTSHQNNLNTFNIWWHRIYTVIPKGRNSEEVLDQGKTEDIRADSRCRDEGSWEGMGDGHHQTPPETWMRWMVLGRWDGGNKSYCCSPGVPPFQLLLPPPEPGLSSGRNVNNSVLEVESGKCPPVPSPPAWII